MSMSHDLSQLVSRIAEERGESVSTDHLWYAIRGALEPASLINNLAEALRATPAEVEQTLKEHGLSDIVTQYRLQKEEDSGTPTPGSGVPVSEVEIEPPFSELFSVTFSPSLETRVSVKQALVETFGELVSSISDTAAEDPFAKLFRSDVVGYHDEFIAREAPKIDAFIEKQFPAGGPQYLVNSGIGANEQFNHYVSALHNARPDKRTHWLVINSPQHLLQLPADATVDNTLFMEFSRSGKTEETLKVHEYTRREAKRIVFANGGPLRAIGERDGNLLLNLPDQVSGRFGRNKTPILLAPMYVCGLDTAAFWRNIDGAIRAFDLSSPESLPLNIAKFIFLHQEAEKVNHIYLGCNRPAFMSLVDEFTQYWNEGVNKDENDIMMSRYLGLPRDSHMTLEGILGNHATKMGVFFVSDHRPSENLPSLVVRDIDPIDTNHEGLIFGDEEVLLAEANFQRFCELMPSIKITAHGAPSLKHAAVLSQLWADITFCYSRLRGIDPGSNPEVKAVRDRSAKLLAASAAKKRTET